MNPHKRCQVKVKTGMHNNNQKSKYLSRLQEITVI